MHKIFDRVSVTPITVERGTLRALLYTQLQQYFSASKTRNCNNDNRSIAINFVCLYFRESPDTGGHN